jgi:hypothetical protein
MAVTELPRREQHLERLAANDRWIDDWFRATRGEEIAWICAPHVLVYLLRPAEGTFVTEPASRRRAEVLYNRERNRPPRGSKLAGGHLFLAFSANQRLSQDPIAAELGSEEQTPADMETPHQRERELFDRALAVIEELIGAARRQSLQLPVKRRRLYQIVLGSARELAWWETVIAELVPRSVVVGSTHSFSCRALALAARRTGVPSVYVPHASVLRDASLCDLPVDHAALWGPAEADYYAGFGAARAGMEAVGHAGLTIADDVPAQRQQRVAYAVPGYDPTVHPALAALIADALGDEVIASPHPRADRAEVRAALPAGWSLWPQRTIELLRQRPPALLMWLSGVGLEALHLGVPTIELAFPGEPPNYAFVRPPHVPLVSDSAALRQAVRAAAEADDRQHERLRDYATEWISATGPNAARAGAESLERAAAAGPRKAPVWDAWGEESAPRRSLAAANPSL